jgi:hypothetical protein
MDSAVSGKSAIANGAKVNGASSGKFTGANEPSCSAATTAIDGRLRS